MVRILAVAFCGLTLWAGPQFEPAEVCSLCHSKIPAPGTANENVAPHFLWTGTMKANAARDPYWRAKVREEVAVNPKAASVIEDKCLRCHAPAQQFAYRAQNKPMPFNAINTLGEEGVTCTVCHQITAKGLGTKPSFTAGFDIGLDGKIYGPHAGPFAMPMMHHTSYRPTEGKHVLESAFCGTCHTVITPTLDPKGKVVGEFVEQAPYLEWLASAYAAEGRSCASCHMPVLNQPSYIAHRPPGGPFPPTDPRTPFGRHFFTGGNVQGPAMLAETLPDQKLYFDAVSRRAQDLLSRGISLQATSTQNQAATRLIVTVENRSGHKLPTAYPSRRMWLHVTALDSSGQVIWESGAWDPSTGDLRNGPAVQPHHQSITNPNQVMIYEAEHAGIDGRPTHSLLRAARYYKDNRILPRGFTHKAALPTGIEFASIAPAGTDGDPDFTAGSDQVTYEIPAKPARILVEALYQSIKPTHAASTGTQPNAEARRFTELYQRHRDPVVMQSIEIRTFPSTPSR